MVAGLFAQGPDNGEPGKNLTYKVVKNDPETSFLCANIDPWNTLISRSRMTFAAKTGLCGYHNNVYVNLSGDFHYLDYLADATTSNVNGKSIYATQASRNINVSAAYFFTKVTPCSLTLYLASVGRVRYHAKIKTECSKFFGPEIGYSSGFSLVTFDPDNGRVKQPVNVTEYYAGQTTELKGAFSTYMQYQWVMVGACFGRIANVEVDFEQYGLRRERSMKKYTLCAILPASSTFEDIYVEKTVITNSSKTLYYRYVVNNLPHSRIGLKLSYDYVPINTSMNYGFDTGFLPGFKNGGNFFVQFRFGVTLGRKK